MADQTPEQMPRRILFSGADIQAELNAWKERAEKAEATIPSCGHPARCIVSSDEGTNCCGWCADIQGRESAQARVEELEADVERLSGALRGAAECD